MKIYIDKDFRCHTTNTDDTFREFEDKFFDGKCVTLIEGYMYIPDGESWTRSDGAVFEGKIVTPWKPYAELAAAQAQYERDMAELQTAYQEGVNSV